jgi:hypothetical protein
MAYEDYSEDFNSVMPYHVMILDVKEKGLSELLMWILLLIHCISGILREFLFTGSRIGFYDPVLKLFKEVNGSANETSTAGEMFIVGQSVGALSGALVNPVEVLKIRWGFV